MFKTEKIKISLTPKNIGRYRKIYGEHLKNKEIIEININELSLNSRAKIEVICDKCGIEKSIPYNDYTKHKKPYGEYYCVSCKGESIKQGCLRIHGVENVFQLEEVKRKIKSTCKEKYNVEHHLQNPSILAKQIKTNRERYNVDFQMQNPENVKKSQQTCLLKFGSRSNMGNVEVLEKCHKSGLKIKKYKDTDLYYQGSYELDFLDKYFNIFDIKRGPSIKYVFNDEEHIYHSDFIIGKLNLVVEIKALNWFNQHQDMVLAKEKATRELGYDYILILDKKYEQFNIYKKQ